MSEGAEMTRIVRQLIGNALRRMRVAMPGRIVEYDRAEQTAEIELQLQPVVPYIDSRGAQVRGRNTHEELPHLHAVPIGHPRGGGYYVHFPLVPGDHVWVMFSDWSLDEFSRTGRVSKPLDIGNHELFPYAIPATSPVAGEQELDEGPPSADGLTIGRIGQRPIELRPNGDIHLGGEVVVSDGQVHITGDLVVTGQVTAGAANPSTQVSVTTHTHPTAMGPTGTPTPGS